MCPDINSLPASPSTTSPSPHQQRAVHHPLHSQHSPSGSSFLGLATMNNHTATPLGDSSHSVATDLPHRPAPVASARSALPAPERRRSAAGSNSILNISNGSASESVSGETPLAPHDHRSSLSHNALRTSSSSSLGGSPIIAMGDPHHQRAPSLGELHQELEQEQEAQVNRLLLLIRSQQTQLQQLQQQQQQLSGGTAVLDDASPPSERTVPFPPVPPHPASGGRSSTQLASSLSSRRPSRPSSQVGSPSLRPRADSSRGPEALEWIGGTGESPARRGSRDESAYYQAEATMLARENQMLRQRIRELERQVSDFTLGAQSSQSSVPSSRPETDVASPQEPAGRGSASDLSDKT
ncbi:uncharacterized protein BP01DRAFT_84463 [Aspergillus saccharolyticus JOP 1030-1]|uniref:BZIP domain-containing protein n=1 Tax=Aspergillus saccharolyticus JOP 1030-1 TaxID=1450539 RepID=A0A318Z9W4_9EURO|nr:hypothetical protein BP01DRAFT_84463 [Aspergillus saccharolyticus JOP 1030-1]PYH44205.1 hypothetical protein BP01DRAFT_84463 [Aspergillus saccharolyticus JOP 1030-1]